MSPRLTPVITQPAVADAPQNASTPLRAAEESPGHTERAGSAEAGAPKRTRPPGALKFAVLEQPSPIDGTGAFAGEAIPARRKIGEIRGESISVPEARRRARGLARIMIVEVSDKRAIDASASTDPLRFVNHGCQPNAVLRIRQGRVEFYALRDIAPGEEITAHYGESHHEGRLRCRCGAPMCSGRL